jgi:hypothetical protein
MAVASNPRPPKAWPRPARSNSPGIAEMSPNQVEMKRNWSISDELVRTPAEKRRRTAKCRCGDEERRSTQGMSSVHHRVYVYYSKVGP